MKTFIILKIKKNYLYQVILKDPDYKRLHRLLLSCDFKPTGGVELIKDIVWCDRKIGRKNLGFYVTVQPIH